jgi:hypothetical protein
VPRLSAAAVKALRDVAETAKKASTRATREYIMRRHAEGAGLKTIAKELGVSHVWVWRVVARGK